MAIMDTRYYVFIMTDKCNKSLFTGISRDLKKKVNERKSRFLSRFIKRVPTKLVYYEVFSDPYYAGVREREIKSHSRLRKRELIQCMNKDWRDLYEDL